MQFTIKGSHILAVLITAAIGWWMYGGEVRIGGQSAGVESEAAETTPKTADAGGDRFKVNVVSIKPVTREQVISVRGRTKAQAIIPIRSETGGVLEQRLVERGSKVKNGDLVCVIRQGARKADLASAQARFEQASEDYSSSEKLQKKGFTTQTAMRQKRFELNAAKAQLEQAEIELSRTEIRANAAGIVQDPIAEVGDVLTQGGTCVTLIDSDPMFFTGQVSERVINQVKVGMNAGLQLVTGEQTSGEVNYISPSSDAATRTFTVEIRLAENNSAIRDGVTATANIELPSEEAIRISPSWITLQDNGAVGVKIVDEAGKVQFKPVTILAQTLEGFWVGGLASGDKVITLGQEYVVSGEIVEAVPMPVEKAEVQQ